MKTETKDVQESEGMVHTCVDGYDLYDAQGRFVRHVENRRSAADGGSTDVPLAAGVYLVAVPDGRRPHLWVEVRIEDGRLTTADVTTLHAPPR